MFGLVQGEANAIQPGKRPLSSMTPTIVLRDGKLFMVVGAPGGGRIITAVLQVILNVIDFGMNVQDAVDAPRFHHQWKPDKIDDGARLLAGHRCRCCSSRGHKVDEAIPTVSPGSFAIVLDGGWLQGGAGRAQLRQGRRTTKQRQLNEARSFYASVREPPADHGLARPHLGCGRSRGGDLLRASSISTGAITLRFANSATGSATPN